VAEIKFASDSSVGTIIPFSGKGKENAETVGCQKATGIALNLNDHRTLGAGVNNSYLDAILSSMIPFPQLPNQPCD
jgi:hypothetical protein